MINAATAITTATPHLANKPHGWVLACLVISIILFVFGGAYAFLLKAFWATVIAAGLAFFVLAFIVSN